MGSIDLTHTLLSVIINSYVFLGEDSGEDEDYSSEDGEAFAKNTDADTRAEENSPGD